MARSTTNILDYMGLIINYLRNRRVGVLERDYTGIIFEASDSVLAR